MLAPCAPRTNPLIRPPAVAHVQRSASLPLTVAVNSSPRMPLWMHDEWEAPGVVLASPVAAARTPTGVQVALTVPEAVAAVVRGAVPVGAGAAAVVGVPISGAVGEAAASGDTAVEGAAPAPTPLRVKLVTFAHILRDDAPYRCGFVAMNVNQLGDGLVTGGVLLMLSALASRDAVLSVVGVGVFLLVEIAIASVSFLQASHQRDNAEALRRAGFTPPAEHANHAARLVKSGGIDVLAAALLLGGVAGASFAEFGAASDFAVICSVKAVQAFNKSYENGAWNCLKYSLGSEQTQQRQLDMRATINALEMAVGGMLYGIASLGTFLALHFVGLSFPAAAPFVALATVSLGGLLSGGAKMGFGHRAGVAASPSRPGQTALLEGTGPEAC